MESETIVHEIMEASCYDSLIRTIVPTHAVLLSSMVDSLPVECDRILELGCGTGILTRMLSDACPEAEITAIDISEGMVDLARSRDGLESVHFLVRDLRDPWPGGRFDAVVAALCLHHVSPEERWRTVFRAADCLGPGGRFICGDIFRAGTPFEERILTTYWEKAMRRSRAPEHIISGMLRQRETNAPMFSTISGFREILASAGFARTWVPFTSEFVGLVAGEMGEGFLDTVPESTCHPCPPRDGWTLCRP